MNKTSQEFICMSRVYLRGDIILIIFPNLQRNFNEAIYNLIAALLIIRHSPTAFNIYELNMNRNSHVSQKKQKKNRQWTNNLKSKSVQLKFLVYDKGRCFRAALTYDCFRRGITEDYITYEFSHQH